MRRHEIPEIRDRYDVVIAGARVAGASTGMLLARAGLRVLVVDPARRGSDTLSTHALMRAGVLQLRRWGLLDGLREAGTPTVRETTFHYGDESVTVPIKVEDGVDGLYAPRRTVLDSLLVEAALEAGAEVVHGLSLTDLARDADGRVRGARVRSADGTEREVTADLVVGADGLNSRVGRLVGARDVRVLPHATASIYGYVPDLEIEAFEWYFGDGLATGAIPTNDGDTCVFASFAPRALREGRARGLETIFGEVVGAASPELAERIRARGGPRVRAFAGAPTSLRRAWGPGWALVGDAGYFKDPLTAHGITDALIDAELLARATAEGSDDAFRSYQATRDELARGVMEVTSEVASLDWTMEEIKDLHVRLSREMSSEVEFVRAWDRAPVAA